MSPIFVLGEINLKIENNPFLSWSMCVLEPYGFEDFPVIKKLPDCFFYHSFPKLFGLCPQNEYPDHLMFVYLASL